MMDSQQTLAAAQTTGPGTDAPCVFVVGNSRSGTTMMGRVLGRHTAVFTFNELHFFEQLWTPEANPDPLTPDAAQALAARVLTIQHDSYYHQGDPARFTAEAATAIASLQPPIYPPQVLGAVFEHMARANGKQWACDQTPRNLYYLDEILQLFPNAYVVVMVRDARDVLLSQKNRWRRRFLGSPNVPLKQTLRVWSQYHPITTSMLWRSGIVTGDRFNGRERVYTMRFEDLVQQPEAKLRDLCAFIGLEFEPEMMQVPRIHSSNRADVGGTGIDPSVAGRWRQGGLSNTELFLCQRVAGERLAAHGYEVQPQRPNPFTLVGQLLIWGFKLALTLLLNVQRTKNLVESVRRRIAR